MDSKGQDWKECAPRWAVSLLSEKDLFQKGDETTWLSSLPWQSIHSLKNGIIALKINLSGLWPEIQGNCEWAGKQRKLYGRALDLESYIL